MHTIMKELMSPSVLLLSSKKKKKKKKKKVKHTNQKSWYLPTVSIGNTMRISYATHLNISEAAEKKLRNSGDCRKDEKLFNLLFLSFVTIFIQLRNSGDCRKDEKLLFLSFVTIFIQSVFKLSLKQVHFQNCLFKLHSKTNTKVRKSISQFYNDIKTF